MNYEESLAYIESLAPTILNPDLTRFAAFMKQHGSVQNSYPAIHVAGTNGKGSTVAIVDSVLRAAGLKVGRFTGPHLLRWNERFHLNGIPIDDSNFARLATEVRIKSEAFGAAHPEHGALTWFELLTAIAFFYFGESAVDMAVFEVGLGGRWDATNVVERPLVSAITTIDYDHMHILGDTLSLIAAEKAGIIKEGVPVVTGTTGDALDTIRAKAIEMNAPLYQCLAPDAVTGPQQLSMSGFDQAAEHLALLGSYQRFNALIAFAVLRIAEQSKRIPFEECLSDGFKNAYWPGRFQWLPEQNLVLDGAHNVAGARALRAALDGYFPESKRTFILGFFQNKDVLGAIEHLVCPGDSVLATESNTSRATFSSDSIVQKATELGATAAKFDSVASALAQLQSGGAGILPAPKLALPTPGILVVTGSFAIVKESMQALGWRSVEDGIKSTYGLARAGCRIHK